MSDHTFVVGQVYRVRYMNTVNPERYTVPGPFEHVLLYCGLQKGTLRHVFMNCYLVKKDDIPRFDFLIPRLISDEEIISVSDPREAAIMLEP